MLLALTCFVVLIIVLKALRLHPWIGAVIAAAVTIALKPYLASIHVDSGIAGGLGIGAALLLLPYYLGPLLIHATQRASAAPRFEPYDATLHRTPDSIATSARETTDSLVAAGFARVGDVFQTGYMARMATRIVLFEKTSTRQQAACIGIYLDSEPFRIVANYVEILASFSDGRTLLANNATVFGANAPVPGKTIEQFPAVRDPARLAAIHEKLIERARGEASLVLRDRSQEIPAYLAGLLIREMEQQIPPAYLWLDRSANAYRPTWKGAALMCWKLLPPMSTLRHARIRRRAEQLLAEVGLAGADARPVSVPPVTRKLSWAAVAAIGIFAAYITGVDTAPAGALEPPPASMVPADFEVPNDFPGAVRALEQLAGATAGPLMVRDSLGTRVKTSGASIGIPVELADSIIAGAQRRFLERGFFLFRHEPNYGLNGRPDEVSLVPMWDHYRVVKLVGTNGANFDITNAQVIIWLHELEQDAPFVLTGVGYDHIEGRFTGRIADPYAMARRLYSFCPDIVDQGTGSVAALALELRRLNTFSCWWD